MKTLISILVTGFIFLCLPSNAQKTNSTHQNPPAVSKGYYSIGSNAQKLQPASNLSYTDAGLPIVNKGFYALEQNRRKLNRQTRLTYTGLPQRKTAITKGYYSIGSNAEKLQK